MKHKTQKTT